jgi:EAL domain-containing protein (putative c-di-GMP-specific phosphodiesterase class I)
MAHSIGMKVVAEGIEVSQHASCLRDMGCEELQGYHYSKPLAEEPLLKVLAQQPYLI